MSTRYIAPLRCAMCSGIIEKKPKAKTPRYCPPCRTKRQEDWKRQSSDRTSKQFNR